MTAIARFASDTREVFEPPPRPAWLERRQSHIASINTLPQDVLLVMAADKAQECLEWTLNLALRPQINAVLPGSIKTEAVAELGEAFERETARVIPLHRFGTPEEVGQAVAFFALLQASYITGQTLVVDGGQVLQESPLYFAS